MGNPSNFPSQLIQSTKINIKKWLWQIVMLQLFLCITVSANGPIRLSEQEKQSIKLIRELEKFGKKTLHLQLNKKFYTEWQIPEQQNTYLYTSRSDSILLPDHFPAFEFFGTDTLAARIKADSLSNVGFDELIYRTSGTSAVRLTHYMLYYPPEAIVFIVLHEMAHVHRQQAKLEIPYAAEESFGDFLGNVAGEYFVQKYHPEFLKEFQLQRKIHENLYALFIKAESRLQGRTGIAKNSINAQSQVHLNNLLLSANAFQCDRFDYKMNNAYLLRNRFYYRWYNLFLETYNSGKTFPEMVNYYSVFPINVE